MNSFSRILYIDDEEDLVRLAESFFLDENFKIDTAITFQSALEQIKANDYDLIISDARMPTGSGLDLLELIRREKYFKGKFILVTGNLESQDDERIHECDHLFFKPVRFNELIDKVQDLLQSSSNKTGQ